MIFAPSLEVLPGHVSADNFATTTERKVESTIRHEGIEPGTSDIDARFDDPVCDDFRNSSVSRHKNIVITMQPVEKTVFMNYTLIFYPF